MTKGEVIYVRPAVEKEPVKKPPVQKTIKEEPIRMTMGMVAYRPPLKPKAIIESDSLPQNKIRVIDARVDTVIPPEKFIMGKAKIEPPVKTEPTIQKDSIKLALVEIVGNNQSECSYTLGQVAFVVTENKIEDPIVVAQPEAAKTETEEPVIKTASVISCYPNPATGNVTLSYEVKNRCNVVGDVYDIHGRFVKQLFSVKNHYEGTYHTGIDLSELNNGEYMIRMQIGEEMMTTKVILVK